MPKFPKLEHLVHHSVDYAQMVKKIGNEMESISVDLEELLTPDIILVSLTTNGQLLSRDVLQKTFEAYDRAIDLDSARKRVLQFLESRMVYTVQNLSVIVGSVVAAKLMGTIRGLGALARMHACEVQLLGATKKNLAGFSTATSQFCIGYIELIKVFQSIPPRLRMPSLGCKAHPCRSSRFHEKRSKQEHRKDII